MRQHCTVYKVLVLESEVVCVVSVLHAAHGGQNTEFEVFLMGELSFKLLRRYHVKGRFHASKTILISKKFHSCFFLLCVTSDQFFTLCIKILLTKEHLCCFAFVSGCVTDNSAGVFPNLQPCTK